MFIENKYWTQDEIDELAKKYDEDIVDSLKLGNVVKTTNGTLILDFNSRKCFIVGQDGDTILTGLSWTYYAEPVSRSYIMKIIFPFECKSLSI